jgi:ergothioneine biosynthesis protein EgtB
MSELRLVPAEGCVYGVAMRSAGSAGEAAGTGTDGLVGLVLAARRATVELTAELEVDDWSAQSMQDASPVKWHLAHTTWFFDRFVLRALGLPPITAASTPDCVHADAYDYLFNSYYESVGQRQPRPRRGLLTRPTAAEVLAYRRAVDARLADLAGSSNLALVAAALELGLNHEEQHQELLLTDVKHLFAQNRLEPAFRKAPRPARGVSGSETRPLAWHRFEGGLVGIGASGEDFCFDNELPRHQVFLRPFEIASRLVTNAEYLAFVEDGGYRRPELWLSEGWAFVQQAQAPLYWDLSARTEFTLAGRRALDLRAPVTHVTYYEADAYARWAGARLSREAEWEIACERSLEGRAESRGAFLDDGTLHPTPAHGEGLVQMMGDAWEWTSSAYEPYPGFRPLAGAFAEYNGKFMVSQLVLRGGSCATPARHARATYRNFFPPNAAWQFTGIRLAKDVA